MNRFDGRRVLITGAGSGIGRATALRLLSEGATVVGADVSSDGLAATAQAAADVAEPDQFVSRAIDIGDEGSVRDGVAFATEHLGGLDVLVNAAGILREIERVRDETGAAVLFISHDLGVVEELCDRVLVMKEGRIVEELDRDTLRAGEARHPYTRMLLDAVPRLSAGQVQR